jgi:Flp pilus assembly protein TadG
MKSHGGQALVELALCLPLILVLGLGGVAAVHVLDASSGLDAATRAAANAASRASDATAAAAAGQSRFAAVIAAYPVRSPELKLELGTFARGSTLTATATGFVDIAWESIAGIPAHLALQATSSRNVEPWRTRR